MVLGRAINRYFNPAAFLGFFSSVSGFEKINFKYFGNQKFIIGV